MDSALTSKLSITNRKTVFILTLAVLAFVLLTLTQDFLRANLRNSAFYFSESFLFSSFWWIFVPLLFVQYSVIKNRNTPKLEFQIVVIVLPMVIHLLAFPFLVWILSKTFYYHTYAFQQVLRYTLSEHLYLLLLFYSLPILAFQYFLNRTFEEEIFEMRESNGARQFIDTILVAESNHKRVIAVSEICYFAANPPYITIYANDEKHLHNETLKSISTKLNPQQFVRIHKSTIVNIKMVAAYTTRLNGDYDLTMKNKTQLRVSRNFAADFKSLLHKTHQVTTE
ncbi:MAG: LytR/AlgR family response regulator transcription factor [Cyclobacteriaceae bacterium]